MPRFLEALGSCLAPGETFFHTSFAFFFDSIPFVLHLKVHCVSKTTTFPSKGASGAPWMTFVRFCSNCCWISRDFGMMLPLFLSALVKLLVILGRLLGVRGRLELRFFFT